MGPVGKETGAPRAEVPPLGAPRGRGRALNAACLTQLLTAFPMTFHAARSGDAGEATSRRKGEGCLGNHSVLFLLSLSWGLGPDDVHRSCSLHPGGDAEDIEEQALA